MNSYSEKFEKMRIAGKLAAQTLDMLTENIKEGISTAYIDKLGYEFIRDNGGYSAPLYYRGFNKSLCTSLNHVVCHGIPSEDRILEDGDAINIDVMSSDFMDKIKRLDTTKSYFVICRSGGRSLSACDSMSGIGFRHLTNMEGGMLGWTGKVIAL